MEFPRAAAGEVEIPGGKGDGGGLAGGDFLGEAGAGEDAAYEVLAQHFGDDLMRQAAAARFEALAHPDQGHGAGQGGQGFGRAPQAGDGSGDDDEFGVGDGPGEVGCDGDAFRQRVAGEEAPVFAQGDELGGDVLFAAPEGDAMAPGEGDGQGGAPGSGSEDGEVHAVNISSPRPGCCARSPRHRPCGGP